jgi:thioredoxin 1
MSITKANTETYKDLVSEGFTIVDFFSTTCVPCKMFSRILEDLTLDYPFINIVKVNVTDDPALGAEFNIEAVPTVMFYKDGEPLETVVGLMDEDEVVDKISEYYYG